MKRLKILSVLLCLAAFTGCSASLPVIGERLSPPEPEPGPEQAANTPKAVPQLNNIKSICQLATLKCYYHNVAKSNKSAGTGLTHLGEVDRVFWIDYTGTAEIGYDVNKIKMEQNGTEITITLPPPTVECNVEPSSWNEDSYIISDDSPVPFKKNPITAQNQNEAIRNAQAEMKRSILKNPSLLASAETQAQELIGNYIKQIGKLTDVEYHITWKSAEE